MDQFGRPKPNWPSTLHSVSGHIERRGSKVFYVSVEGPRDPLTGKRTRRGRTIHGTKKEAQEALDQLAFESRESISGANSTLKVLIREWLLLIEHSVEVTTLQGYRWLSEKYVIPALGDIKVKNLSTQDLDRFYVALIKNRGLSTSTVRHSHVIIRRSLKQALQWGWIPRNPAELATVPRQERPRISPPTIDEVSLLVETASAADPAFGDFILVSAATGARRGEMCGLRWRNVNFDDAEIVFDTSIAEFEGLFEKDTKTHASRRIAVDPATLSVLEEQRHRSDLRAAEFGVTVTPNSFVFSDSADGSRPWAPSWVTHTFARVRREAGLERVRLHDLRHFAATLLMASGIPVRTVSGRLGHANPSTTLSVYSHFVAASDREAANVIGEQLSPAKKAVPSDGKSVLLPSRTRRPANPLRSEGR